MKVKVLLRFYFCADGLESALENLILKCALSSAEGFGEECADRILKVLEEKRELSRLWAYMDGVLSPMPCADRQALEEYAVMRCGLKSTSAENYRRVRRAVIKFTRRAKRLESFKEGVCALGKYYCLIPPYLSGRT